MAKKRDAVVEPVREMDSPFMEVAIVERPSGVKHQWQVSEQVQMIAETVQTGKAVKLAARTDAAMKLIQNALRHQVRQMGLKMSYRKEAAGRIVAWAEKVGETK